MPSPFPSFRSLLAAVALAGVLSGCVSTKLVRDWVDPEYRGPAYRKFLVMTVWEGARARRILEDQFVRQLEQRGVAAVPSYRLIPKDGRVPREVVVKAMREAGADAVLLTLLRGTEERSQEYKGDPWFGSGGVVVAKGKSSYSAFWVGYQTPMEETDDTVWNLETRLFDARSEQLVWTGLTEARNPEEIHSGSRDVAGVVIETLVKKGMVP